MYKHSPIFISPTRPVPTILCKAQSGLHHTSTAIPYSTVYKHSPVYVSPGQSVLHQSGKTSPYSTMFKRSPFYISPVSPVPTVLCSSACPVSWVQHANLSVHWSFCTVDVSIKQDHSLQYYAQAQIVFGFRLSTTHKCFQTNSSSCVSVQNQDTSNVKFTSMLHTIYLISLINIFQQL